MDNDRSIKYKRIFSECAIAVGFVAISKTKIPMELDNGKACQPFGKPWDYDFYLYQRAFPGT